MTLPKGGSESPLPAAGGGSNERLGPNWWRTEAILAARLRDLVTGLDSIGALSIPYGRLPRRLGIYAEEFPRWADVADQTPQALLLRPKLGVSAVEALIDAAREAVRINQDAIAAGKVGAVTAVGRLVARLDDFDRTILSARVWTSRPQSQRVVAERLGVNPVSVQRNQARAQARFAELLADPAHQEVTEHAAELGRRLGPYLPADLLDAELRRLDVDPSNLAAQLLLHLAGPYVDQGQWLENTTTKTRTKAAAVLEAVFAHKPAPSTDSLLRAVTRLGIRSPIAMAYLESRAELRRFGDVWVRVPDDTTATIAEAALHVIGAPATPVAILATIGSISSTSLTTLNGKLSEDERFIRASRRTWGLRAWGIAEYAGIARAIGAAIDARGGNARVDDLITDLLARYPDVSERSIRTYMSTLEFVTHAGIVRRRTSADEWPPVPPLSAVRGAFRNGHNEIRLALPVTADLLRGSGQPIHPAVATAVGVIPGQRRTFAGSHGEATVVWNLSSTTGANIGSLRVYAVAAEAAVADTLVLAFRVDDATLEVTRVDPDAVGMRRLRQLLGRTVRSPVAALAASLQCRRSDVSAVLRAR
ncbi:hypothetical protein [Mycobacterium sp. URHB0021]